MSIITSKFSQATFASVIIPVYNDTKGLKVCLEALSQQLYKDFEILVIDNGSTKPGIEAVCGQFEHVTLLNEQKPSSYAARNKGLTVAKGDIIAFTDADCIPDEHWLRLGIERLLKTSNCGIVAGRIKVFPYDLKSPTAAELYEMRWAFPQKTFVENEKFAATANVFTFRTVLDAVGNFNDSLKSAGDREWGNRVTNQGYAIVYDHEVCINHPARRSVHELKSKFRRSTGGRRDVDKSQRAGVLLLLKYLKPPVKTLVQTIRDDRVEFNLAQKLQVCYVIVSLRVTLVIEVIRLWWGNAPSTRA